MIDISRTELIALIRELRPDRLFSVVTGPFYRAAAARQEPVASVGGQAEIRATTSWNVNCPTSNASTNDETGSCTVRNTSGNVMISTGSAKEAIGFDDRCADTPLEVHVDDRASLRFPEDQERLIEQMHFGHELHVAYSACPGHETRQVNLSLNGFAIAFAKAYAANLALRPEERKNAN